MPVVTLLVYRCGVCLRTFRGPAGVERVYCVHCEAWRTVKGAGLPHPEQEG